VTANFTIRPFTTTDQADVEALVLTIQRDEFGYDLTTDNQPDLKDVGAYFAGVGSAFWVAVADGKVIGCIGLEAIAGPVAVMRKFMVAQAWRGRELGVARALYDRFVDQARDNGAPLIALSTVSSTKAAQAFYLRMGYKVVERADMPTGFVPGVMDVVFMVARV
jgi:ribosomal protein S18 acetylase RimI-like enzyme